MIIILCLFLQSWRAPIDLIDHRYKPHINWRITKHIWWHVGYNFPNFEGYSNNWKLARSRHLNQTRWTNGKSANISMCVIPLLFHSWLNWRRRLRSSVFCFRKKIKHHLSHTQPNELFSLLFYNSCRCVSVSMMEGGTHTNDLLTLFSLYYTHTSAIALYFSKKLILWLQKNHIQLKVNNWIFPFP